MAEIRFTRIDELSSGDIHDLVRELEQACSIPAANFASSPLNSWVNALVAGFASSPSMA